MRRGLILVEVIKLIAVKVGRLLVIVRYRWLHNRLRNALNGGVVELGYVRVVERRGSRQALLWIKMQ